MAKSPTKSSRPRARPGTNSDAERGDTELMLRENARTGANAPAKSPRPQARDFDKTPTAEKGDSKPKKKDKPTKKRAMGGQVTGSKCRGMGAATRGGMYNK